MKKLISFVLIILTIALILCGCQDFNKATITKERIPDENIGLAVHFIDVGQGDSALLESKGNFALIDGGEYKESYKLISYLSSQGVDELEFIISTHPHSDHCGGLSEVIRNFKTKTLICPDVETDSNVWEYVLDAADERGVAFKTPSPNDKFDLGSSTITILSPSKNSVYSDMNNYSIVCKAEYGNTSFLFTGDAEKLIENEIMNNKFDVSADILKCGHHGSTSSSSEDFIDAVNPSVVIIPCGKDNDYGHPHRETLETFSERNIPVYRTDKDGNILVTSDGEKLFVSTASQSPIPVTSASKVVTEEKEYIGNKNSKVYHNPDCSSVDKMSEKNKVILKNKEQAIEGNYKPCGSCNP